ncbi:uncharacterized protein LOC119692054 isoform X2 [Plutella xylostella]|uniref:uncharacterized protein LOC119692054 isoform X1 n=1 Tax=Plutella xylostella TaxID=51655 RepID=UPI0020331920|nr:uncharacterized protein LOC119692054 isoform X1 [Plutella xylostella]XP_048478895.1 uncharacterized protein LOC119692054 isoform X2 [Plutella xylostella]
MDNITVRKPFSRTHSNIDLYEIAHRDETVWNSTIFDNSSHSLPSQTLNTSQNCNTKLQSQINHLTQELESAHQEIMTLNNENHNLKITLVEKDKQIEMLKKLISTDVSTSHKRTESTPLMKRIRNVLLRTPRNSPIHSDSIINKQIHFSPNKCQTQTEGTMKKGNCDLPTISDNDKQPAHHSKSWKKNATDVTTGTKKPQIIIIGDQRMQGLASKIIASRMNKWNDVYKISATVKPQAHTSHILSTLESQNLRPEDVVVLAVGSNDYSISSIISELNKCLPNLITCKVLLLNVQRNKHVNIHKLNESLCSLTKEYNNCYFVDLKYNKYGTNYDF